MAAGTQFTCAPRKCVCRVPCVCSVYVYACTCMGVCMHVRVWVCVWDAYETSAVTSNIRLRAHGEGDRSCEGVPQMNFHEPCVIKSNQTQGFQEEFVRSKRPSQWEKRRVKRVRNRCASKVREKSRERPSDRSIDRLTGREMSLEAGTRLWVPAPCRCSPSRVAVACFRVSFACESLPAPPPSRITASRITETRITEPTEMTEHVNRTNSKKERARNESETRASARKREK